MLLHFYTRQKKANKYFLICIVVRIRPYVYIFSVCPFNSSKFISGAILHFRNRLSSWLFQFCYCISRDGNAQKQLSTAADLGSDDRLHFIAYCDWEKFHRRKLLRWTVQLNRLVTIYNCSTRNVFKSTSIRYMFSRE